MKCLIKEKVRLILLLHNVLAFRDRSLENQDYEEVSAIGFLADPGEARGCSINSLVIN